MRFRGTGTHVQYPENTVVDLDPTDASGATLIAEGAIEPLPLEQDPARTPSQLAASAQRGEFGLGSVGDPVDRGLALRNGYIDALGRPTPLAYKETQGDGLVQGEQPAEVSAFADQRGVAPEALEEEISSIGEQRSALRTESIGATESASVNLAGSVLPDEAIAAQEAGEEPNPQESTEGEGQPAPGSETQVGETSGDAEPVAIGSSGEDGEDTPGPTETEARSARGKRGGQQTKDNEKS